MTTRHTTCHALLVLVAMLLSCCASDNQITAQTTMNTMNITIDGQTQRVTLADNAATKALVERLQQASVSVTLNSSGDFEIWGALGFSLPTSNRQMTAQPGDVVLYNGSNICLFYGTNAWSYTPLGKIEGLTGQALRSFLKAGESHISVVLSLPPNETGIHEVQGADAEGICHTLNGLRAMQPQRGLYVKNGKKVIARR